ncbi:MAG: hypothetical protein QME51_05885 [Planctomycetota bacterium]|nr:hypothetical protein [Planctomycetota bacterium]MDI6787882.1 hypothetical protein [Planctomycetota bacterium]
MVKNYKILEQFEDEQIRKEKLSYERKLAIFESLWNEYRSLHKEITYNPLEGIETDIRIARILNSVNSHKTTTCKS